jgi:hypothetical protein
MFITFKKVCPLDQPLPKELQPPQPHLKQWKSGHGKPVNTQRNGVERHPRSIESLRLLKRWKNRPPRREKHKSVQKRHMWRPLVRP